MFAQARYYMPEVGRFVSEDSYKGKVVNPLSLNGYAYCVNNPINRFDLSGFDSYVFYDPVNFKAQAYSEGNQLKKVYGTYVHMIPIRTEDDFKMAWNSMGMDDNYNAVKIDGVSLLFHGSPHTLNIDYEKKEYLTTMKNGKTPHNNPALYIGKLNKKKMTSLNILTCNGGHLNHLDDNLAVTFLKFNSIDFVTAMDGALGYTKIGNYYYPRTALTLGDFYAYANGQDPSDVSTTDILEDMVTTRIPKGEVIYIKDNKGKIIHITKLN